MHRKSFESAKTEQREKFYNLEQKSLGLDIKRGKEEVESFKDEWVVNSSSRTLDPTAESLLKRVLSFAITWKSLSVEDIVLATEEVCKDLDEEKAAGLRSEVAKTVKRSKPPRSNISLEERMALLNIKLDKNIRIIPTDKRKATVIPNISDYKTEECMKCSRKT